MLPPHCLISPFPPLSLPLLLPLYPLPSLFSPPPPHASSSPFSPPLHISTLSSISYTFTASQCPNPIPPSNGAVTVSGLSIGSTASYTCLPGFNMVGMATRQCQQDATWSNSAPMCQGVCPGAMGFQNMPTYGCAGQYLYLYSSPFLSLFCLSSTPTHPPTPKKAIGCDPLTPPENGKVTTSGNTVGSTATYSCFPGFDLQGSATAQCQSTGKWTPSAPTCSRK